MAQDTNLNAFMTEFQDKAVKARQALADLEDTGNKLSEQYFAQQEEDASDEHKADVAESTKDKKTDDKSTATRQQNNSSGKTGGGALN